MMRRKNTSRRVHALSSDSIRSDEIAATDMALSREGSRDGVSDMRRAVHDLQYASIDHLMAPGRGKINPASPFAAGQGRDDGTRARC
jgi:putative sterol carrier protein